MQESPLSLCLLGAAPDTSNMGVSALCYSVLGSLARILPSVRVIVFDEGRGVREETTEFSTGPFTFVRCGATGTRRHYRSDSYWNIRICNRLGGLWNPASRSLLAADAVLDISGGDSFTDLYGPRRFAAVSMCKRMALEIGKPLILLPQTYGPYRSPRARRIASEIVRRATMAWARDPRSYEVLKELAGPDFDPQRHRSGVDVAFALEAHVPRVPLPEPLATWFADGSDRTVIGFNVSGLIWNDPEAARSRYGLKADYRECVLGFLHRVLRETDARVVLVPHVLTPVGHYESDPAANEAVLGALSDVPSLSGRVATVPPVYDQSEMKWIIARCDWFCGTRMHACIAGLSSGIPTVAIAYSLKTEGVFETCHCAESVADPRVLETEALIDVLWTAQRTIGPSKTELGVRVPVNSLQAQQQMNGIVDAVGRTVRNLRKGTR